MGRRRSGWRRLYPALILTVLFGCWQFRVRPASPAHLQETLNHPRDAVFDAALSEAHQMNLEVKVIEKASGLLRFETVRLSPDQMDEYCKYPLESTGCRTLPTTFSGAAADNEGGWGLMSITVLVSATGADASLVDIRANGTTTITVRRVTHEFTVDSKGVVERQLLAAMKKAAPERVALPRRRPPGHRDPNLGCSEGARRVARGRAGSRVRWRKPRKSLRHKRLRDALG